VDTSKGIQHQKILVAGDDRRTVPAERCRQHDIVVSVAANWLIECFGDDEGERLGKQLRGGPRIERALTELPFEDLAKLDQQWLRRDDDVLAHAVLEEIAAGATRDQRSDQDIGVEQQLHDT
jgi:hypothetical protein